MTVTGISTDTLVRALLACKQLLAEARAGEIEPGEWSAEELMALIDQLEALLLAEGSGGEIPS